ncbi:MAG: EVE domain-containing protein [Cytophagales bacterium]|nr:EVE domain-containing protein [Armatimonadota bacterium]
MTHSTDPDNGPTHWLLVSSPENFEVSRARGFDIAGMKSRHRKKAETVRAGDTVLFYCVGLKAIAGLAEVTGPSFEDDTHLWDSRKPGEEYPFRFPIRPVAIIENAADFITVEDFLDVLEYPRRWPRENWTLAFQGNVHRFSGEDHAILAGAVKDAAKGIK